MLKLVKSKIHPKTERFLGKMGKTFTKERMPFKKFGSQISIFQTWG
jgi:hypothetical protein